MRIWILLATLLTAALGAVEAGDPPVAPAGTASLHGLWRTSEGGKPERFWARLLSIEKRFGGHRMLQVVYDPPPRAAMGGTVLVDHPFALLDDRLRLVAWNGRHTLTRVVRIKGEAGYQVTRELQIGEGKDARPTSQEATLPGPRTWERHLAPLLLALVWRSGSSGSAPVSDPLGGGPSWTLSWDGVQVRFGERQHRIEQDAQGRLHRLLDPADQPVLVVSEWLDDPEATP